MLNFVGAAYMRRQVFKSGTAFNIEHRKWDGNGLLHSYGTFTAAEGVGAPEGHIFAESL